MVPLNTEHVCNAPAHPHAGMYVDRHTPTHTYTHTHTVCVPYRQGGPSNVVSKENSELCVAFDLVYHKGCLGKIQLNTLCVRALRSTSVILVSFPVTMVTIRAV